MSDNPCLGAAPTRYSGMDVVGTLFKLVKCDGREEASSRS